MRSASSWLLPALLSATLAAGCGDVAAYSSCSPSMSCSGDTRLCLSSAAPSGHSVRFCTKRCSTPAATSSECPGSAACIPLNGGDPVCVPRCAAAAECPFAGAVCSTLPESRGARVCAVQP